MAGAAKPAARSTKAAAPRDGTVSPANAKAGADKANAEVQAKVDEAEAKGYIGETPDPRPNSAYSQESGPDSPGVTEAAETTNAARTAAMHQGAAGK